MPEGQGGWPRKAGFAVCIPQASIALFILRGASDFLCAAPTPFEPFELIEPVSTLSSPSKGRHAPGANPEP